MCSFYTLFVIVFSFPTGTVYMYVWYLYEKRSINQSIYQSFRSLLSQCICLDVCLSHACIVPERLNLSGNFFDPIILVFNPLHLYQIPGGPLQRGR